MGNVLIVYKVYEEELGQETQIEVDIKALALPDQVKLQEVRIEPLAFGLKLLRVAFTWPDKVSGIQEKIDELLKNVKNVREIEVERTTLI